MDRPAPWLNRVSRIVIVAQWFALAIGAFGSATGTGSLASAGVALVLGAMYVVSSSYGLQGLISHPVRLEVTVAAGAIATSAAATFTGGIDSPYVLLGLMPAVLASTVGSLRIGLTTSLLSAGLLAAVAVAQTEDPRLLLDDLGTLALFPLLALVVAQIRSLLEEAELRAETLEVSTALAEARLAQLENAHDLLGRLSKVYGDPSINPVEVGRSALTAIVDALPGSYATAALLDTQGPVVIARVGTDASDLTTTQVPLRSGDRHLGAVTLRTREVLSDEERSQIENSLRPLAVSFENALLLQEIAHTAVEEERMRLSRELHDELGPALASIGFALDMALMESPSPALADSLTTIRNNLSTLIEDMRSLIADLRAEAVPSLRNEINMSISDLGQGPSLDVSLIERRPARPSMARQVTAIIVEAIRNAHRHSGASSITVEGLVDRDEIDVSVSDDGHGFDPRSIPDGHWGLASMRERAAKIGGRLSIQSGPDGSTVKLTWKES
jgi:signal transduction histidine kinase